MSEENEQKLVGVAVMGGAQAAYDEIYYQQISQPESVDTSIPYAQRRTILSGLQDFLTSGERVEAGTEEHARDLFYLTRAVRDAAIRSANVTPDLLEGAETIGFPLIDYLENAGIRGFRMTPALYGELDLAGSNVHPDSLVFVFDSAFEE